MAYLETTQENLGKSKRICWNLQDKKYHMYFEEFVYTWGERPPLDMYEVYKDGCLITYNFERSAWKGNRLHRFLHLKPVEILC